MEKIPAVAVITRTKNRCLLLERAIGSVLEQTSGDWHHVIVNDGGDPAPVDQLVDRYASSYHGRVTVIHNEKSKGMEGASNTGIYASDSKYICIHDDDDTWEPEFLARCMEELENCAFSSVKGVATHTTQVFEDLKEDSVTEKRRQDFDSFLTAVSIPEITEINKFMPISFMFERSVFDEIGFYDESLPVIGDWEFHVRFLMKYDVLVIKENLANYHIRLNSPAAYSNTVTAGKDAHAFYRALIINKHLRNDIDAGRLTPGMLFAYGDYFHRVSGNLWRIARVLDKVKKMPPVNWIRKIFSK